MKLLAITSKNDGMWLVGDSEEDPTKAWYYLAPNVRAYAKNFKKGDAVDILSEAKEGQQTKTITYIKGTPSGGASTGTSSSGASTGTSSTGKTYGKTPEEQESIKRQAIGHMTSRTLIGLQGHIDPNNVEAIIRTLYKLYQEIVG